MKVKNKSMNDVKVKQIDVYAIEERLRKDKSKEGVEVWQYIKALKNVNERQKELTNKAISKIKELATELANYRTPL
jgi:hypothetical protein